MAKRSYRRSARCGKENNVGCVWGLIRMFYFRRDPKFLLDRKQGSRRHTVREITARGCSKKKSRDFEEIDEEDNNREECIVKKPTVKKLMEDELGKVKLSKKIPNDEIERILSDLGHDVCLDKSSMQTSKLKVASNYYTNNLTAPLSGPMDPGGSKSISHTEENDLEFVMADFLGEIYRYHNECPHGDCKNKSELCPALKSLIHKKINDLNNYDCHLDYEQDQESKENKLLDEKHLYSSRTAQSKEFMAALEILSSNKELFLKLLQKPNSHILENIQKQQNKKAWTKLDPGKVLERTNVVEESGSSNQREFTTKTLGRESRHIFFWKKDKSNRRQISEGTDSSQSVSRIVILKPSPGRGLDPVATTSPRSLHQKPSTLQSPEYGEREVSKFSIKEVRSKFRLVSGETRKERNSISADDVQKDTHHLKDSVIAIKKDPRQLPEIGLASKSSSAAQKDSRPSTSSKQKQRNDSQNEINNHINASKDASIFYEEAKKHLTKMLKDKSQIAKFPTVQVSKSLGRLLSLPECSVPSPRSSPGIQDCLDLSPKGTKFPPIHQFEKEESAKDVSQSKENSESIAYDTSATVDMQVEVQEGRCMEEETTQEGGAEATDEVDILSIERSNKLDCSESLCKSLCNECCNPTEQCRDDPMLKMIEEPEPAKEPVEIFLSSPERIIEKPKQQDQETPEPSASTALISHTSPESSHDKQEQPSPASVLDPFFYEDMDSPDCKNTTECELHEDSLVPLYFPDTEADLSIFWEDKNFRFDYIKSVLELSGLCIDKNLEIWYFEDELIDPSLFDKLQAQSDQIDDLKLLFNCICEALTEIQERYFRFSPWLSFLRHNIQTPPVGGNLIVEVNKYIDGHLQYQFPSTLDQIVKKDLEDGTWMDLRSKSEHIIIDISEFILDELIDEAVFDLWI